MAASLRNETLVRPLARAQEDVIDIEDSAATVADVGEFALIDRSIRGRTYSSDVILGPGDDAAVVAAPSGAVVATTDMLVQDRHFRLDWSSPRDIGRRAIAQNGADVAAMGARCTGFLVALACPASLPVSVIDGVTDGMWEEAERAGASIVGGDVVGGRELVISITALGDLGGREAVRRSGARAGDVVAVVGQLGASAAGLALLVAGSTDYADLLAAHRVPTPDYAAGPEAADAGASAMTDISDGLLSDIGHIAAASAVAIDLESARLAPSADLRDAAAHLGVSASEWVLTGGEDHALVATFPAGSALPPRWRAIGSVGSGSGVTVDGVLAEGQTGWTSF